MTLEERVRDLEARAEIIELIGKYSMAVARRDREQILSCFARHGTFDVGGAHLSGVDEIREFLADMQPNKPHLAGFDEVTTSTPLTSNVVIDLDNERAHSTSMGVVFHAGGRAGEPIVMVRGTEYEDDLACIDGSWVFTARRHRTVWEFEAKGSELTAPPRWPR